MKLYEKLASLSSSMDSDPQDCNFQSCTKLGGSLSPKEVVQRYARGEITQPIAASSPDSPFARESAITERGQAFALQQQFLSDVERLSLSSPPVSPELPPPTSAPAAES